MTSGLYVQAHNRRQLIYIYKKPGIVASNPGRKNKAWSNPAAQ
jgi:hypothetical protein